MRKILFDQIFTTMKELGISPQLGTRTNVKRLPTVKHFGNFEVDEKKMEKLINQRGVDEILGMFKTESGYLPNMNDSEGTMFLRNLNKLKPIVNPPENVIPGPGSKGQEATKKILEDEQGVGSLFKETRDVTPVDIVDDLKKIEEDAGSLNDSMNKIKNLAWQMTPEYQAKKDAAHKQWMKKVYEGKGFDNRQGYFRAVVRPFLIDQHKKGIINIPEAQLKSLKESNDLKSGGGAEDLYPDPVRMFRHYYGDDAFDLIPDNIESPATSSILEAFATDINKFKPINTTGKQTGMGYHTPGELIANMEERQKLINDIIKGDEYPISQWTKDHKLETLASVRKQLEEYRLYLQTYYPDIAPNYKGKPSTKLWDMVDETTGAIDDFDPDPTGMAQGGRVGFVKGGAKKGLDALMQKLNKKLGKDTIKKASDLPKGDKYEEFEAVKAFQERNPRINVWEDKEKIRAAVDDIFPTGDYKYDASMAAESLVENNPEAFGNKLYDDLDQYTQMEIYGAVLKPIQQNFAKQLKLKRAMDKASKPTKTLEGIEKTGTIDISDDAIAEEFARFMKETDPEGHAKVQKVVDDANQKLELKRFKTKGRKKNAFGGGVGSMFREV